MKKINNDYFIWAEKYRPQIIDDLIIDNKTKNILKTWLQKGEIPNIGLFGSIPGTGKTSLANILIKTFNSDSLWINASKENGIDVIRSKIGQFASTISIQGNFKIVVYDESDYLSPNAQATLRSDLEVFSKNCRFIFTGNYPEKIIDPLLNRLQIFNLDKIYQNNKKELAIQIFKRLNFILKNEGIKATKEQLQEIIKNYYPSIREMIMFIQNNNIDGELISNQVTQNDIFKNIIKLTKEKKFYDVRKMLNQVTIPDIFYSYFWKNLDDFILEGQPEVVIKLAKYQDMNIKAKNKYITLMAFLTEIMLDKNIKFKKFKEGE